MTLDWCWEIFIQREWMWITMTLLVMTGLESAVTPSCGHGYLRAQLLQILMVATCICLCPVKESWQYLAERGVLGESVPAIGSMEIISGPGGGPGDHHLSFCWLWPERGLVNQHLTGHDMTCLPTGLAWLCWSPASYLNTQPEDTCPVVSPYCGHCSWAWNLWGPLASCESARPAPAH